MSRIIKKITVYSLAVVLVVSPLPGIPLLAYASAQSDASGVPTIVYQVLGALFTAALGGVITGLFMLKGKKLDESGQLRKDMLTQLSNVQAQLERMTTRSNELQVDIFREIERASALRVALIETESDKGRLLDILSEVCRALSVLEESHDAERAELILKRTHCSDVLADIRRRDGEREVTISELSKSGAQKRPAELTEQ